MPTNDVRGTARGDFDGDGRFDGWCKCPLSYWEAGPAAVDYFSWERQTYVLEGAEFRLVEEATGRYERSEGQLSPPG